MKGFQHRETGEGIEFALFVQPRASREEFVGVHGEELKLALTAPAVEGAANKACIAFLSKAFSVPKSAIRILRGETSRHKRVAIAGNPAALAAKLQTFI